MQEYTDESKKAREREGIQKRKKRKNASAEEILHNAVAPEDAAKDDLRESVCDLTAVVELDNVWALLMAGKISERNTTLT